jgi:Flp pilus assembly protein TadG
MHRRSLATASHRRSSRRGAAAVEFALVAPLFVTLTMGAIQAGIGISAAESLTSALREGGRLASMDASDHLLTNQTLNEKVIKDIKAFLTAERIDGSQVTVTITRADGDSAGSTFDLSDPTNDLELFMIRAVIPYSAVSSVTFFPHSAQTISASIVFRKGQTLQ